MGTDKIIREVLARFTASDLLNYRKKVNCYNLLTCPELTRINHVICSDSEPLISDNNKLKIGFTFRL